ncbi:MAG TPA: alpha/beta hydrolase [Thermoanaerobaculia bacterium]|nr:alpha/beta hydrolase [Thermoanaerobaculia bacterium]
MSRGSGRSLPKHRGRRIAGRLLLAGVAVGVPLAAAALLRRRVGRPEPPRWGRAHRYTGRSGREVVFQELGSGPPVLLLHSFGPGYGSGQWRAAAEILAENHRVYVPDLPGWGRTRGPAGAQHPDGYLSLIEDFLTGAVREPAVVVGAGLAAVYAVHAALDHPGRVRALALVSPLGLGEAGDGSLAAGRSFVARLVNLPLAGAVVLDLLTARTALEHHLRREVYAAPERVDAALLEEHYLTSHAREARAAFAAYLRGELWLPVSEELSRLRMPVWLAWGRHSKAPPVATADLWLRHLPQAELDVFEGAGSLPNSESPALFCRALERFLAKLPE